MTPQRDQPIQHPTSFDAILLNAQMPEPGPEYYAARRRLWLTPPSSPIDTTSRSSIDRSKLEKGLKERNYASEAWRVISSGQQLKRSLPLDYLIKIIHAAWLRDKTWPVGVVVVDSDGDQAMDQTGNNLGAA